jgi:Cu(I)/Ag(I) efflux system membrane fusion protein
MVVGATVQAQVADEGKGINPELEGKWISPMHPEIIEEEPGTCDICGMDLVRAKSLGYLPADPRQDEAPLVIPSSAPLITGKRAVVYVAVPDQPGVYEGREIVLGSRAGDRYIVREGLQEGEKVVVHGNFKIDSAIQIQAKPSMMNPQGGGPAPGHDHGSGQSSQPESSSHSPSLSVPESKPDTASQAEESATQTLVEVPAAFSEQIARLYKRYLELHAALVNDDLSQAKQAAADCRKTLQAVDMSLIQGEAHHRWMEQSGLLDGGLDRITQAESIDIARTTFESVAETLRVVIQTFGVDGTGEVHVIRCPMAFDGRGARWLQSTDQIQNPYFGSKMKRCGNIVETLNTNTPISAEPEVHNHE